MGRDDATGARAEVGIIGGSGLYSVDKIRDMKRGPTKDSLRRAFRCLHHGPLRGRRVAFLARHGRGHRIRPSEVNYRANIYGFKLLGVERVFSASAVGSLREEILPSTSSARSVRRSDVATRVHILRRRGRGTCFARRSVLPPLSHRFARPATRRAVSDRAAPTSASRGRSSRRGPSRAIYRSWGLSVIGMTNAGGSAGARSRDLLCHACAGRPTTTAGTSEEHRSPSRQVIDRFVDNAPMARTSDPRFDRRPPGDRRMRL